MNPVNGVAMEKLFQVKNSHYRNVACNLSAEMLQQPREIIISVSTNLNTARFCCSPEKALSFWGYVLLYRRAVS